MKLQSAAKKELLHISVGVLVCCVAMNGVYLLLSRWQLSVLWGTLLGGGYAILNFLFLILSAQRALAAGERAGAVMRSTYMLRMLGVVAMMVVAVVVPVFDTIAAVIPLLFPRLTILVMQLCGMYKPDGTEPEKEESSSDEH